MNENLHEYLLSINCTVVNPVKENYDSNIPVGWHCKSTSLLRKDHHLEMLNKFIKMNKIDYYISDYSGIEFFIYKNN